MDCIGLPLIFILDEMKKNNYVIDWCDFIDYTIEKKWDVHQTLSKIEEALIDNKKEKDEIISRIKIYLKKKFNLSSF